MKRTLPLLLIIIFGLTVAPTGGIAAEDPRFETHVSEPTLLPGQTQQVAVQLVNDAEDVDERVETARNVKAEMRSGSTPFEIKSGTKLVGSMPDGTPVPVSFTLEAPQDIEPGTYSIPISLEYEFEDDESESTTVSATVRIEDRAYFNIVSSESSLPKEGTGTVNLTVKNIGTKSAHNATITTSSSSPDIMFGQGNTASSYVDSWQPGETKSITYDVRSVEGSEKQEYTLTTTVGYKDHLGSTARSVPMDSGLQLLPAQEFTFDDVRSTLQVGEKGRITATVRNDGPRPVSDAVVTLGRTAQTLSPHETEYGLGSLSVGEAKTVSFPITVASSGEPSPRRFPFTVSYRNVEEDLQQTDETYLTLGVSEERDQFGVAQTRNTLRVGEEGALGMTVTNNGEPVEDVVVTLLPAGQNVHPKETEYAIGDIESDGTAAVDFPIEISENAESVPRQFSVQMSYEDAEGDDQQTSPMNLRVEIGEAQERFDIDPVSATIPAGNAEKIEVSITNNGNEPVDNINAKIFADDPLSANDDEAYVDTLEPGESETVVFSVGVAGTALQKVYPLSMDMQYDENSDTKLSDTYQIPITVTEPDGRDRPSNTTIAGVVGGTILLIGAFVLYRRR